MNQPSVHSPRPPALPTLVQYYCTIIGQYMTPPPNSRLYAMHHTILVITISCKGQIIVPLGVFSISLYLHPPWVRTSRGRPMSVIGERIVVYVYCCDECIVVSLSLCVVVHCAHRPRASATSSPPPSHIGLYSYRILPIPIPIVYRVLHNKRGVGGCRILRSRRRAIVVQYCGQYM